MDKDKVEEALADLAERLENRMAILEGEVRALQRALDYEIGGITNDVDRLKRDLEAVTR